MSGLARIRRVAGSTAFAFLASIAWGGPAASPPAAAPGSSAASASTAAAASHAAPPLGDQPVVLAPKGTAQIAHSALLTVDGTATDDSLKLSIRRAGDKSLITSGDITVTVDGKNEPVTHENGAGYEVPINDLRGDGSHESARDVEIIVPHDGIREILSGKVAVAEGASATSLLGDHKQMAWWILNIVIVFVAAMAISRRKG
jgi:hypothetical protein